jgi:hypothetical protein
MQGALHVAKDPLQSRQVRSPWGMHMEADLLNSIGNIRSSEREVLKSVG